VGYLLPKSEIWQTKGYEDFIALSLYQNAFTYSVLNAPWLMQTYSLLVIALFLLGMFIG